MMSKSQFISLTTLILFILLIVMISLFQNVESEFNDIFIESIAGEEVTYQLENIFLVLDEVLNAEFTLKNTEDYTNVSLRTYLSSDMNPDQDLRAYNDFLENYNTTIRQTITYYNFSDIIYDLSENEIYGRFVLPTYNYYTYDYVADTITITNASKASNYIITIYCSDDYSYDVTPNAIGTDFYLTLKPTNNAPYTRGIDNTNNYNFNIYCDTDNLRISYDKNNDELIFDYSRVEGLLIDIEASFSNGYGNIFKISSPYSQSSVMLTYNNYTITRGLS